jgi:hypothetical protein
MASNVPRTEKPFLQLWSVQMAGNSGPVMVERELNFKTFHLYRKAFPVQIASIVPCTEKPFF